MADPDESAAFAAFAASAAAGGHKQQQEAAPAQRRLSCTKCFDALYFCYSPFYQMQQYYRYGEFDTCFGKWNALFDCLSLKTKKASEIQEILEARDKAKMHIWTYRTVEEASVNWWNMHSHFFIRPIPRPDQLVSDGSVKMNKNGIPDLKGS